MNKEFMKRKWLLLLILVIVIAGLAGFLVMKKKGTESVKVSADKLDNVTENNQAPKMTEEHDSSAQTNTETMPKGSDDVNNKGTGEISGQFSSGEEVEGSDLQVVRVVFNGENVDPKITEIAVGDIVWFENSSNTPFYPIADNLSTFKAFDAGKELKKGERFELKFSSKGTFSFHDKNNMKVTGVINVK